MFIHSHNFQLDTENSKSLEHGKNMGPQITAQNTHTGLSYEQKKKKNKLLLY